MYKSMRFLRIAMLLPLLLTLTGCIPVPVNSSRSSEKPSQLAYRFNQDYPFVKDYRLLLIIPSDSYIDLVGIGGSLQDGPGPEIQMSLFKNGSSKIQNKKLASNKVACFYIKPGKYDLLFKNKHIKPSQIEQNLIVSQLINIINLHASGLYGAGTLTVRRAPLSKVLPLMYDEYISREKCLLID